MTASAVLGLAVYTSLSLLVFNLCVSVGVAWQCGKKTFLPSKIFLHCYKTLRRIPPPGPDGAGLIGLGKGK
jgi:hypothetical protein